MQDESDEGEHGHAVVEPMPVSHDVRSLSDGTLGRGHRLLKFGVLERIEQVHHGFACLHARLMAEGFAHAYGLDLSRFASCSRSLLYTPPAVMPAMMRAPTYSTHWSGLRMSTMLI